MKYFLLTGATGFLGRYLLRDLLAGGLRVACLVRAGKVDTAGERVEAVMRHWETLAGHALPRPVVFEGDLWKEDLGLSGEARSWIAGHVEVVIHSAAAMSFRPDDRGEPWRTNVEGTRRVLQLCREASVGQLHHVSTAYVCGLRTGRILESELDLGQTLGNVYEDSKLKAEKLVHAADWIASRTVYRPSSIVGDSRTGYTTSYHGFYLPLQLAYVIASRIPPEQMDRRFLDLLGLDGSEGKNLVPVDWLSQALFRLIVDPRHHGRTYHMASPDPVPVALVQQVIQEAIRDYSKRPPARRLSEAEMASYEKLFQEYMDIYRSHWRDDPRFDLSQSQAVLAGFACPKMDRELLLRVSRYAVENEFTQRRHQPLELSFDAARHLERMTAAAGNGRAGESVDRVALQVNGAGGGQWQLLVHEGRLVRAELGLDGQADGGYYLNTDTFAALVRGRMTVEQSIHAGRVVLEGNRGRHAELIRILQQLVSIA